MSSKDVRLLSAKVHCLSSQGRLQEGEAEIETMSELMPKSPLDVGWGHGYPAAMIPLFARISGITDHFNVAASAVKKSFHGIQQN